MGGMQCGKYDTFRSVYTRALIFAALVGTCIKREWREENIKD